MGDPARQRATWEDLLGVPAHLFAEIRAGELRVSPRSRLAHGRTIRTLGRHVGGPFDDDTEGPGGWWITIEPAIALGGDILCPDLAGWRRERMPQLPDDLPIRLVPDWVCEVLSPSTARDDRTDKADLYLRGGVASYWLVDPRERVLEAWIAVSGRWVRQGAWTDGERPRIPPFDAIELDVGRLFAPRE